MPDWLMQLVTLLAGSAAVYAAIRVDIALAKAKAEQACNRADHAHERIDNMMAPQRGRG